MMTPLVFLLTLIIPLIKYFYFSGTRAYMPPEFLRSGWYDGCQSTVWALGMILSEMVSPYRAFNRPELALTREPWIPEYLSEGISTKTNYSIERQVRRGKEEF